MGLFDLFKKKPKHEDLVRAVYTFLENKDKQIVKILFPGGTGELGKIIISLSLICKIKLEKSPPETYLKLGELYSMTMLQYGFKEKYTKAIVAYLRNKYPEIIVTDDIGICLLVFYNLHSADKSFFLTDESSINQFMFYVQAQMKADEIVESNIDMLDKNLMDEDYGLVETKPIYVSSGVGANNYLRRLCGSCGEFLTWEMIETIDVKGINGKLDVYEAKNVSGDVYATLYLNIYAPSTSTTIPKGLSSKEEIAKKLSKFEEVMNVENYDSNKIRSTLFRNQQFDDSEYGLSEYNPIITSSNSATENYLSRLRSANKELLFWVKEGTMIVNNINGISNVPVDVYQIFLHGEKFLKIYICSYGRDSSNVPQNLCLAEKPFPGHNGNLDKESISQNKSIETVLSIQKINYEYEEQKKMLQQEHEDALQKIASEIKQKYDNFSFENEMNNRLFSSLTDYFSFRDNPAKMVTVYEYLHKDELFKKKDKNNRIDVGKTKLDSTQDYLLYLQSTISPPSGKSPTQEEIKKFSEETGVSLERAMKMLQTSVECDMYSYQQSLENFEIWSKQAAQLKQEYPQFNLQQEYESEDFKTILKFSDIKTAYEVIHFYEFFALKCEEKTSVEKVDSIFCRKCGTSIPGDSVFCYKCGEKVEI